MDSSKIAGSTPSKRDGSNHPTQKLLKFFFWGDAAAAAPGPDGVNLLAANPFSQKKLGAGASYHIIDNYAVELNWDRMGSLVDLSVDNGRKLLLAFGFSGSCGMGTICCIFSILRSCRELKKIFQFLFVKLTENNVWIYFSKHHDKILRNLRNKTI